MALSKRELAVLKEVVGIYTRTGEPVASGQVARLSELGLSSATIRNVMADLEERQLLSRPHTSAGCTPTDAGFRAYVNSLEKERQLPVRARRALEERLCGSQRELVEGMGWVAQVVAESTNEAGIAARPMGEGPTLEAVSLVPLSGRRFLGILVTQQGGMEKVAGALPKKLSGEELLQAANYLTQRFRGQQLEQIDAELEPSGEAEEAQGQEPEAKLARLAAEIWQLIFARFSPSEHSEVLVAGTDNLLQASEFATVERVRSALSALQDHAAIVREWQRGFHTAKTQIIIGGESEITSSGQLGMVATLYFCGGRRAGAVGVIGPCRMDYSRIVPVVEFIADTLTKMLEQPGASYA